MFSPLSFQEASLPPRVLKCHSVSGAGCFPVLPVNLFTLYMVDVPPTFEEYCFSFGNKQMRKSHGFLREPMVFWGTQAIKHGLVTLQWDE